QLRAQVAAIARLKRQLVVIRGEVRAAIARIDDCPLADEAHMTTERQAQLLLDAQDARAGQVIGPRLAPRRILPLDQIVDARGEERGPADQADALAAGVDP